MRLPSGCPRQGLQSPRTSSSPYLIENVSQHTSSLTFLLSNQIFPAVFPIFLPVTGGTYFPTAKSAKNLLSILQFLKNLHFTQPHTCKTWCSTTCSVFVPKSFLPRIKETSCSYLASCTLSSSHSLCTHFFHPSLFRLFLV